MTFLTFLGKMSLESGDASRTNIDPHGAYIGDVVEELCSFKKLRIRWRCLSPRWPKGGRARFRLRRPRCW